MHQDHRRAREGAAHAAFVGAEFRDDALVPVIEIWHGLPSCVDSAASGRRTQQRLAGAVAAEADLKVRSQCLPQLKYLGTVNDDAAEVTHSA